MDSSHYSGVCSAPVSLLFSVVGLVWFLKRACGAGRSSTLSILLHVALRGDSHLRAAGGGGESGPSGRASLVPAVEDRSGQVVDSARALGCRPVFWGEGPWGGGGAL